MARHGVYVLEHNSGCFYVGSSNDIDNRVAQHRNNPVVNNRHGGIFRVHQPMAPPNPNLRSWERDETIRRMMEHGIDRIRGWEFTEDILSLDNLHMIRTLFFGDFDLCRRCGFRGHYQGQCNTDPDRRAAWFCEIERLQMERQGQNNNPNGGNFVNLCDDDDDDDSGDDDDDERRCERCNVDISKQPQNHWLCKTCHYAQ